MSVMPIPRPISMDTTLSILFGENVFCVYVFRGHFCLPCANFDVWKGYSTCIDNVEESKLDLNCNINLLAFKIHLP